MYLCLFFFFFFQAEDGIRDWSVTGVQTCALPISSERAPAGGDGDRTSDWPAAGWGDPHRNDLLVARHRAVGLRVDRGSGLRHRAGDQSLHRGHRRGRELDDRPALRRGGSTHPVRLMATVQDAVVRRPEARTGRGRSPAHAAWLRLVASPVARAGFAIVGVFVLIAVLTPAVHHYDATTDADLTLRLKPPTAAHPLGTDTLGRDILVRVLHATRVSLGLAVSAVAVAAVVGSLLGFLAGYLPRRVDLVLMFCLAS